MAQKVHFWVYILKEKQKTPTNLKGYMHPNAHKQRYLQLPGYGGNLANSCEELTHWKRL